MTFDSIWNIVQAVLGVGLVIFVHEAGHFMAARWCKVRVEVFSLGFGPVLFGWKRGDTQYQIAAVPLGGYVKMAGEDIYDPAAEKKSDDLGSKSVPQRFLIYSGGVIMNMIFALIVFPIILMIGVPSDQPMITPVKGGPAWLAGLEQGTVIEEVNGQPIFDFMHIPGKVALSDEGDVDLLVREPGADKARIVSVTPIKSRTEGLYTIAVGPAADQENRIQVTRGSAAEKAGLKSGFRLVSMETEYGGLSLLQQLNHEQLDGKPLNATFLNDADEEFSVTIEPLGDESKTRDLLGVTPLSNVVKAIRPSRLTEQLSLEPGDRILRVSPSESGVAPEGAWSVNITQSGDLNRALQGAQGLVNFWVEGDLEPRTVDLGVADQDAANALAADIALTSDLESTAVRVMAESAADKAGLRSGDEILEIDGSSIAAYEAIVSASKAAGEEERAVKLVVRRQHFGSEPTEHTFEFAAESYTPVSYGLDLKRAQYIYKAAGPIEAVQMGFISSWRLIEDAFLTIRGIIFTKNIPGNALGGFITIGVVANSWASAGLAKLFFFLCLLSVNLAFLNVLPIPVLDGGHLTFLLIEGIKGSPVSEKVMGYSQLVGLVMIVSLMIYVIKNDIVRWIL